jgi:selT/selW/selH-like putative selenoprotein
LPQASRLEAALRQELGITAALIQGDRGVFDVRADGELVFSKKKTGRFPTNAEIVDLLRGGA